MSAVAADSLLARLLHARLGEDADRVALQSGTARWTYGQLTRAVESTARALRACGVTPGDRVMICLPNSPEFVVAFLAITSAGAIAVPIDYQAGPERLAFISDDTTPALCLHHPDRTMPDGFPTPCRAITVAGGDVGVRLAPEAPAHDGAGALPDVAGAAPAVILFSAGSTGRPKGALLEHRQLLRIARTLVEVVGMDREHVDLVLSPMTHSGGWQRVTSTMLAGGRVVIASTPVAVPTILEDVRESGVRAFFAAPPLLRALMSAAPERVRRACATLRSIESASAPLSPEELDRLMSLLPDIDVYFQYGLTECSRACILDARAHPDKLHTVGLPTAGVEVSIADDDGRTLPTGVKGEVRLAAEQRADRYWNRPDLDREKFDGPWLRTGDVGSLDAQGFLTYHGRRDDMINCGGLSYFPAEVERELGPVEGVAEYLVAGVPDPRGILGAIPWIFVVPETPEAWSSATLMAQARNRLPPHMVPRRVVTIPSMPLIASGKPNRRRVVEEWGPQAAPQS